MSGESYDGPAQPAKKRRAIGDGDNYDSILSLNANHAVVLAGDKTVILKEMVDSEGKPDVRWLSVDAFQQFHWNQWISLGGERASIAKLWLAHPERRTYCGITFSPEPHSADYYLEHPQAHHGEYYNLWSGFAVNPAPGDCSLFLDHVRANVCNGNEDLFAWVMGWFADIFQHPASKSGTALVLRGGQGVGKTKVGEVMGSLLGRHHALVDDPRYLVGQFNSHMEALLLLQADEGFWAGDRAAEGRLKGMVTSDAHFVERKGVDAYRVRNYVRLLITSNSSWVVPAGLDERRFAVLDVAEYAKQNHEYFAALDRQMNEGGREALLHYLLNFDLGKVNVRRVPETIALSEQVVATLHGVEAWWFECLQNGSIASDSDEWPIEITTRAVFNSYLRHAEAIGVRHRSLSTLVGMQLRKMIPGGLRKVRGAAENGSRPYVYRLPPLEECRIYFSEVFGRPFEWE